VLLQSYKPARDFVLVAFGIDAREGPADAAESLARLRRIVPELPAEGLHALTGSDSHVAAVTKALGYRYAWDDQIGQYAHVAATAVLTPDGRLARWLYGLAPDPLDVRLALTEAGDGRIGHWGDQLLLLCYHYNPHTGRYGTIIWTVLRVAGFTVVAAGGALIGRAMLREHRAAKRERP
jgi:protein SCO1/2